MYDDECYKIAVEKLGADASDKDLDYLASSYFDRQLDIKSNLYAARQEGFSEGIFEWKIGVANKLFAKGVSITDICEVTGLKEKDFH